MGTGRDRECILRVLHRGFAGVFYRKISGETEADAISEADIAEVLGEDERENAPEAAKEKPTKGGKRKATTVYGMGAIFPEYFSNTLRERRTGEG